jgi:hypothetical protein
MLFKYTMYISSCLQGVRFGCKGPALKLEWVACLSRLPSTLPRRQGHQIAGEIDARKRRSALTVCKYRLRVQQNHVNSRSFFYVSSCRTPSVEDPKVKKKFYGLSQPLRV